MPVFKALIILAVLFIWIKTYNKVALWLDRKTSIKLGENLDRIKQDNKKEETKKEEEKGNDNV
mgnify:CR=1 FL=1